jgi:PAS domain-containing protein
MRLSDWRFFDRRCRFVRVNRIFAETTGIPLSRHLGRTLPEVLATPVARQLEKIIQGVFDQDRPIRDLEVSGLSATSEGAETAARPWTWITSAYPIHTNSPKEVRWVGLIVLDASDRKRSEEALRKTEKLAATGRLAASIAHEINNPLEAITNLLYLLSNHCGPHRAGAQLCGDGRARGAAHLRDHPADAALLSAIHAAGALQSSRNCSTPCSACTRDGCATWVFSSKKSTTPIPICTALPANSARSSPT